MNIYWISIGFSIVIMMAVEKLIKQYMIKQKNDLNEMGRICFHEYATIYHCKKYK